MKASEFDKNFDDGENILAELDVSRARRPGEETRRINCRFPRLDGGVPGPRSETPWGNPPIDYKNVVG